MVYFTGYMLIAHVHNFKPLKVYLPFGVAADWHGLND